MHVFNMCVMWHINAIWELHPKLFRIISLYSYFYSGSNINASISVRRLLLLSSYPVLVGLSGTCSPLNLRAAHGGQWLVPTSLKSSLHGPGCKMKIRTFLDREFEHQMNDCAGRLGVGSSPKTVSTHCSSHMNMDGSAWAGEWRCPWPDLTAPDHVRKGEGESEQVGGKLSLQS